MVCVLLLITSCSKEKPKKSKSIKDLQNKTDYPEWLVEKSIDIERVIILYENIKEGPHKEGRKNYNNLIKSTKQFLYLVNNGINNEYHPYWMYNLGLNLLCLDEDHAAYQELTKLINLPKDTKYTTKVKRLTTLEDLKELPKALRIRILARNNQKEDLHKALKNYKANQNYSAFNIAVSYMLIGEKDKAVEHLYKALEPEIFIRLHKRSSATAGAAGMAYAMGKYDDVFALSEWMIKMGRDITDENYMEFDENGNKDSYRVDQWQSSYDIAVKYRELTKLAKNGKEFKFNSLKDGSYSGTCRGFIDKIDVEIKVDKGTISNINVVSSKEDRPYSTLRIIPNRILKRQSLEVDAVTNATITSHAIIAATAEAAIKAF